MRITIFFTKQVLTLNHSIMRTVFLYFCLCLTVMNAFTQSLKRKGSLGVGFYMTTPDSLVQQLQLANKNGALVKFIVPNGTSEALQIQVNDLITHINGNPIHNGQELLATAQKLRAETAITIEIERKGKSQILKGVVKPKPTEQNEWADITYDDFPFDNGYVRTILKMPKGKKPLGIVYCLQGISCYSVDNLPLNDPVRNIMDGFLKNGFAVYCVEKSGMGDSETQTPCAKMGFHQETALFKAGYEKLLTIKGIDIKNIFLFGHSLGGITAPILAQTFQPKGVVVYGTVLKPWSEYLLDVHKYQPQFYGEDLALIQDTLELMKPTLHALFYGQQSAEQLAQNPTHLWALQRALEYQPNGECLAGRQWYFHKEINDINLPKAWKATNSYVLAVFGGADNAAMYPQGHEEIANYVNKVHPGKGTFLFLPKTNHHLQEVGTMEEWVSMEGNPEMAKHAADHFNWKGIDQICEWMQDKVSREL